MGGKSGDREVENMILLQPSKRKTMKQILTILASLLLITTITYGQKNKTYTRGDFTLKYPSDWTLNIEPDIELAGFSPVMVIYAPQDWLGDNFVENFNLLLAESNGVTLDAFANVSVLQINYMGADIAYSKKDKKKGREYYEMVYEADHGNGKLKFMQQYWLHNGQFYILTFTAKPNTYENYEKTVKKIFKSVKMK